MMKWVYGLVAIVSILAIILTLRLAGVFEQRVTAPTPPSIPQATAPALPPIPAPATKQPASSTGPQLLSPCNNCTVACITRNWQFHWYSYNGATVYRFELSENADMSAPLVATTVESTSYSYQSALKCDTRYFWRVRAVSPISSDWSQVWSFLAARELPPPDSLDRPQLQSPCDGCTIACYPRNWQFFWLPFKDATGYEFWLSENADLTAPLVSTWQRATSYTYPGTLRCNTRYYWRVRALEPVKSDWSEIWFFSTSELPPPPPPR